jgi:predicted ThiF/HesA family dinucleotide-utilizing enzyme
MSEHLQKYVQYIKNTAHVPLRTDWFDDDWEPVGPMVREQLVKANLITVSDDGIRLVQP